MSIIDVPKYPTQDEMLAGLQEALKEGIKTGRGRTPWKRIARRLRSKYRRELALEKARHAATKQALIMMIQTLADSIGVVNDSEWGEVKPQSSPFDDSEWGEEKPQSSPLYCEHANEAPTYCPCEPGCYCKTRTCASKEKPS